MIEQFYLTHRLDPNRNSQSGSEKEHSIFPKSPGVEPFPPMLFSILSGTLIGVASDYSEVVQSAYSIAPVDRVKFLYR